MFEVCLGSARYVETVPGQKTDIQDCQRLQYLRFPGALGVSGSTAEEEDPQMEGCRRGGELFLAEERSAALQRSQDARDQLALRDAHHHAALLPLGIAVAEVPQKIRPAQLHPDRVQGMVDDGHGSVSA